MKLSSFFSVLFLVLISFVIPPIPVINKTIYTFDFLVLITSAFGFFIVLKKADRKLKKETLLWVLGSFFYFLVCYLHGSFRVSIAEELKQNILQLHETDTFVAGREAIQALRFWSWFVVSFLILKIFSLKKSDPDQKHYFIKTEKCFAVLFPLVSISLILERIFPKFREIYLLFYSGNPFYEHWSTRAQGLFRSPLEAGAFISAGIFMLLGSRNLSTGTKIGSSTLGMISLFLTKSFAPILGFLFSFVYYAATALPSKLRLRILGVFIFFFALTMWFYYWHDVWFFVGKRNDFIYRLGPWQTYLKLLFSRFDFLILGLGFPPYHVDQTVLFLLTRLGLIGTVFLTVFILRKIILFWRMLSPVDQSFLILVGVTSLALDILIYRHFLTLVFCFFIPRFASKTKSPA